MVLAAFEQLDAFRKESIRGSAGRLAWTPQAEETWRQLGAELGTPRLGRAAMS